MIVFESEDLVPSGYFFNVIACEVIELALKYFTEIIIEK